MQRTVRINLDLTEEQRQDLEKTIAQYAVIYNEYATWFTKNKTTSKILGHRAIYHSHNMSGLPTALIQSARDNASESIKSYNSRFPKKKWAKTPKYKAQNMRLNLRSMNLRGSLLTYSTVNKRTKTLIAIPEYFTRKYGVAGVLQAGRVGIDKHGNAYALLVFKYPERARRAVGKTVGLDRGLHNLVFTSEGVKYSGKPVRANKRKHLYVSQQLQAKGTRSALRLLKSRSGREERFSLNVNHQISTQLASNTTVKTYVLEDLTGISVKKKVKWQKHSNKRVGNWAHAQLLELLKYKCEDAGINLVFVDPRYTSQDCSRCKSRSQAARSGSRYMCGRCGFKGHADLNAALNIRDRGLELQTLS